jgi:uncharacterized membrane protein
MVPALVGAYALHMAVTVVWLGGLAYLAVFQPALARRLPATEQRLLAEASSRRFRPYAWTCLAVFAGTGLLQMSASPRYEGLLVVGSLWSAAILAKHMVIVAMAGILGYQSWVLQPRLERARFAPPDSAVSVEKDHLADLRLHRVSLFLGGLVLILTAVARASA